MLHASPNFALGKCLTSPEQPPRTKPVAQRDYSYSIFMPFLFGRMCPQHSWAQRLDVGEL